MALELVTGYWGQNHVTAEQEADLNAGIFGSGFYVLPVGEKMRAEAVASNQVRIFDGIFVGYGRQASIEEGGYENVTIENGTAGLLRNDMIVVKYTKDEKSGVEGVAFEVLKGQTGESAQDPVPNNQDIRAGAFESEMPLYRVKLNGLAIEAIEPLFTVPKSIPELMQDISDLEDANDALNSALANIITSKPFSEWGSTNPGDQQTRFTNDEARGASELIFVLQGAHSSEIAYEYIHIKTPFSTMENSYYWANTSAGKLEFYYSATSGIIDVYRLPLTLRQILYVKY